MKLMLKNELPKEGVLSIYTYLQVLMITASRLLYITHENKTYI